MLALWGISTIRQFIRVFVRTAEFRVGPIIQANAIINYLTQSLEETYGDS